MPTVDNTELTIDPEFEELLRPHSEQENEVFLKSIEADGQFTDPIIYWRPPNTEQRIVIDGHRRLAIWDKLKDGNFPEPKLKELFLPDREKVKEWILRHQLGRRNLNQDEFRSFIGRLYNHSKSHHGGDRKSELLNPDAAPENQSCLSEESRNTALDMRQISSGQIVHLIGDSEDQETSEKSHQRTSQEIAKEYGVSERTVRRAGAREDALKNIGEVDAGLVQEIRSGQVSVSDGDILKIGELDHTGIGKAAANLRMGRKWNHRAKRGKEIESAKSFGRTLFSKHYSHLVRGIDRLAELNGGQGRYYAQADLSIKTLGEAIRKMQEGNQ